MKKFMLITNNEKPKNIENANTVIDIIKSLGGEAVWSVMPAPGDSSDMPVPEGTSAIITIGGDGTMVRSAQRTLGSHVPLIGINRGHLGYLCEINEREIDTAIKRLMNEDYITEDRMMLSGYIEKSIDSGENNGKSYSALNDIVLTASNNVTIIRLSIYVNGTYLYGFNGDGVIISTPTGSTGYNLSANGPIVEPGTDLMLVTPINPHTLNSRSIILDPNDEITMMIESRRSGKSESASVVFDGGHRQKLLVGDKLIVSKAKEKTSFIKLDDTSFLERMKTRLGG